MSCSIFDLPKEILNAIPLDGKATARLRATCKYMRQTRTKVLVDYDEYAELSRLTSS